MSSYGWQTETTILSKPAQQIKVHNKAGLLGIQAAIKAAKQSSLSSKPTSKPQPKQNKGIQQRMARDLLPSSSISNSDSKLDPKHIQQSLTTKSKLYQHLNQNGLTTPDSLIDFTTKHLQSDPNYQSIRKQFYDEKLSELELTAKQQSEFTTQEERDRINWEKQKYAEILLGVKKERVKVRQSYDQGLTEEEEQALTEVIQDEKDEKQRIEGVKRRGRELREERVRKLKMKNIIKEKEPEKKDKVQQANQDKPNEPIHHLDPVQEQFKIPKNPTDQTKPSS